VTVQVVQLRAPHVTLPDRPAASTDSFLNEALRAGALHRKWPVLGTVGPHLERLKISGAYLFETGYKVIPPFYQLNSLIFNPLLIPLYIVRCFKDGFQL
jgi:hypothetical protein